MDDGMLPLDQIDTAPLQLNIDAALEELSNQLAQGHTDHYQQVVAFYAKFHHYSMANAILIMQQKPDAEVVAGYRRWQELGHQVQRGHKAAQIWCPVIYKVDDEGDRASDGERAVVGYRTGYVFSDKDLVDSDTLHLPSLRSALPDSQSDLLAYMKGRVVASGVSVREVDRIAGAEGYYNRTNHRIVLESGKDSHNQVLVLLHEWAHALFHQRSDAASWPPAQKEFEAETVTMVMAQILEIESPAAADYLLAYGTTPEQLKQSLAHIHGLVTTMTKHLGLTSPLTDTGPRDTRTGRGSRRDWTSSNRSTVSA